MALLKLLKNWKVSLRFLHKKLFYCRPSIIWYYNTLLDLYKQEWALRDCLTYDELLSYSFEYNIKENEEYIEYIRSQYSYLDKSISHLGLLKEARYQYLKDIIEINWYKNSPL